MGAGDVEARLHGTTLKVYWYLVRVGEPVGVRQLQRALGLSSPSVAAYHLTKLVEMGLVEKDRHGDYRLKEVVQVGALRSFIRISGLMLPRFIFYAAYFATLLAIYIIVYQASLNMDTAFALALGFGGLAFSAYEAWRAWRAKPI